MDALVGGRDPALGSIVLRRVLVRQPAGPVIPGIPTGCGSDASDVVPRSAHRHLADCLVGDAAAAVGHDHVLHGRVEAAVGLDQVVDGLCAVGGQRGLHVAVTLFQRGPAQRKCVAAGVDQVARAARHIADDRTVPGAAHGVLHIGLPLDPDGLHTGFESRPGVPPFRCRHAVLVGLPRAQLLEVQVLHIGTGIGETPSHTRRAAQHHERRPGQGGADHVHAPDATSIRRLKPGEVPDRRCAQAQVGIVREQRLPAGTAAARHHPVVRSLAFDVAQLLRPRAHIRGHRNSVVNGSRCRRLRACRTVHTQFPIELRQIDCRSGLLARVRREQGPQLLRVQHLQSRQARHLIAPVAPQVQRHHQRPACAVGFVPVLASLGCRSRVAAQHQELRRQGLIAMCEEGIDTVAVGLERHTCLIGQKGDLALSHLADAQRAHETVGVQRGRPQQFGQRAAHDAAVELQLPATFLCMHITHGHPGITRVAGPDMGDVRTIALNLNRGAQAGQWQFALGLRQALTRVPGEQDRDAQQGQAQTGQQAPPPAQPACLHEVRGPCPSTMLPSTRRKLTVGVL